MRSVFVLLVAVLPLLFFFSCTEGMYVGGPPDCPVGTVACCPGGKPGECVDTCPPEHACTTSPAGGLGAGCDNDSDCPQPPDTRCGQGRCVEGACALEIKQGPIASQKYGDCKRRECDPNGMVIELDDPLDYYDDGRICTTDYCKDGPVTMALADGTACPGEWRGGLLLSK
jgi:hypothetical protein